MKPDGHAGPSPSRQDLLRSYRAIKPQCERVLRALEEDLRRRLVRLDMHPGLKSRVKAFPSYYRKYIRRVADPNEAEAERIMADLIGIRIICPFLADVTTVETLIRRCYAVEEVERKGEDALPDDFRYKSTHLLLRLPPRFRGPSGPRYCEVQVRTTLQDAWAEVEHELLYKADASPFHESMKRKMAALNANLTLADMIFQEARDYQRELGAALSTRRAAFHEKVRRDGDSSRAAGKTVHGSAASTRPVMNGIEELLLEGLQAHSTRSYGKAIRIYGRILSMELADDMRVLLLSHRGMAYFARSMHHRALEDFLSALAIDPGHAGSCHYAGAVYETLGDAKRALAFFNRSLAADPARVDSLVARARVLFHGGEAKRALADCEEALALDPGSAEALAGKRRVEASMVHAGKRRN